MECHEFVKTSPSITLFADPGNLEIFKDFINQTLPFLIEGKTTGSIWGTGIYTIDSSLGKAAIHSGLLLEGETKILYVTILPGYQDYKGSTQNGITSKSYNHFKGSFQFLIP